jgi:pimeloyl-ACP methyl ester carboxylesterase
MTYTANGRQLIVVALSEPSRLIALALPETEEERSGETMKVEVEGAVLHVEVAGPAGAPAVFLWNGAGCTTRMWDLVVPRLAERLRVVRFDVRGTGQSTPAASPAQYTFEQYAADADAILDRLGIERAHVWAMAWGSRAALAYATLRPGRIQKLALFDASIGPADTEAQARGLREALEKQAAAGIAPFERPKGWNEHVHPEAVSQALGAARRFDLEAAADKLEIETLVATGDHDPNLASSRDLVARAKRARLVVMENVGHGSVLQRPDLTADLFLEFIAESH